VNCGTAPVIRVGVVLPEDGRTILDIETSETPYILVAADDSLVRREVSAAQVSFEVGGKGVFARIGSDRVGAGAAWCLEVLPRPCGPKPAAPCGVLLPNAQVGRGFHWEKTTDIRMPGDLEVSAVGGRLLLVNRVPVEEYLLGVITSEMAGECPIEFLKAQCVVARSWALAHAERKHDELGIDYCNDDCCQRFHGVGRVGAAALRAVAETAGEVLLARDGTVVDANYSKCCGGVTEDPRFVWGRPKPGLSSHADAPLSSTLAQMAPIDDANIADYLRGRWLDECDAYCSPGVVPAEQLARFLGPVDSGEAFFRWRINYRREQLQAVLRSKLFARPDLPPGDRLECLMDLRVTARGRSGRATELIITYRAADGAVYTVTVSDQYRIRDCLHETFLYSSALEIEVVRDADGAPDEIVLTGAGWGHGVGFCQIGALGMALGGSDCSEILAHYFRQATQRRVYA